MKKKTYTSPGEWAKDVLGKAIKEFPGTEKEFAAANGINYNLVRRWRMEGGNLEWATVQKIALAAGVPVPDLVVKSKK